jgi:hypothetical protein
MDGLDVLERARPAALDACDDDVRERVWQAAVRSEAHVTDLRPRRRQRAVRAAVLTGVAAALACALVVSSVAHTSSRPAPQAATQLSGRDILLTAARHLEATPATTGKYWHIATNSAGLDERWISRHPNGQSWMRGIVDGAIEKDPDPQAFDFNIEGRDMSLDQLTQLPTDPAALKAFLLAPYSADYQREHPADFVSRLFGEAFDLTTDPVSPDVRAAAYRLIADMPGVESLGTVHDSNGRVGEAVAIGTGNDRSTLIIDPTSGSVLEYDFGGAANVIVATGWTDAVPGQ